VPHALIVDDDAEFRSTLASVVEMQGFSTATAESLKEARGLLAKTPPDVILTDLKLPDGSGLDFCGYIGGVAFDGALGVVVEASGDILLAGSTTSDEATFPVQECVIRTPSPCCWTSVRPAKRGG
jgi:DNA-binding NtrC family response regulator